MAETILTAEIREKKGKGYNKRLRKTGKLPAIFYGHGQNSIPLIIEEKQLRKILASESSIIDLDLGAGKKKRKCIVRKVQFDPVKGEPLHVDLMGIKMTETITVTVPIHLVGTPVGVKEYGGILEQHLREVEVECLPIDIPEHIEVDVGHLRIGDTAYVSDISLDKVHIMTEAGHAIATVVAPKVEKEAVVEEEVAEPEVIGEKEAEEEEEEKPAGKKPEE